ncbi:hypothetical protein SAMN02745131_03206 [Flavisolibacter ginsengisoli DSM 18119]|jgi:hypothetical protein|uniref:Uncharacterized protein n=1 Tax=Flavisolibacter ginsengisoli DSM 18119 TaxID=1121884 RepID=A0A1M5DFM7_9BACT|nr:hypothetical protein SAMN02745131_03206 [Flavisolibacter ginsengisoli DSM 18119]
MDKGNIIAGNTVIPRFFLVETLALMKYTYYVCNTNPLKRTTTIICTWSFHFNTTHL